MSRDNVMTVTADAPAWRDLSSSRAGRAAVGLSLVAAGIALLTAGSWLSVPFYPVPLTMQTLAVLLVGGLLGPRRGPAAVAGYLALGLAGTPVFHNGIGGPAVLLGPTGGYLLGFVPAAFLMGLAARHAGVAGGAVRGVVGGVVDITIDRMVGEVQSEPQAFARGFLTPGGFIAREGDARKEGAWLRDIGILLAGALPALVTIYVCGVSWLTVAYTAGDLSRALVLGAVPYLLGDAVKVAVAVGALRLVATALRGRRFLSL